MAQVYQLSPSLVAIPCTHFERRLRCCHGERVLPRKLQSRLRPPYLFAPDLCSRVVDLSRGVDLSIGDYRRRSERCTVAQAQALPRILPGAGPLRDFLFALIGAVFAFLFAGVLARVWCLEERYFRESSAERGTATMPEMGSNQGQKESVEWVNMVIHKVWKVYRRSLQGWLIQLLQPAIDNLGKPNWVKSVKIVELNLDYEPIIVRTVQRRASRRANDLQYHFGLRYAGGARCLLNLKLGRAGLETVIPVGVYDLDVDAELWVKLRLAPVKPYVGTLSLAFVRLPTIKLVLAPFRVVNLFSIPFLNNFLSKLLTVDLPRLLVLPRHITFDFLPQGQNVMDSMEAMEASVESGAMDESIASGVLDLLKTASTEPTVPQDDPSEAFVGELSVTICDAWDLPIRGFTGWSNPYCILSLGDQVLESKRNKETSHPSGHKDPVWNQDFLLLVEDPRRQRLMLRIRDSTMTLNPNIGYCQINLAELQDCVPRTMWVNLKRDGLFGPKKVPGRVRIALTYKSYVDEEEEGADEKEGSSSPYIKVYGDSGAESAEDIGVSLGEAVEASLMEEAKRKGVTTTTDEDGESEIPIVSIPREDSSVEVSNASTSSASKNGNVRSTNGAATSRHSNGAPAASRQKIHDSKHGNGAAAAASRHSNGAAAAATSRHGNGAALGRDGATEESFAFSRGFGDNGDVARGFDDNGDVARGFDDNGDVARGFGDNGDVARGFGDNGDVARGFGDNGDVARGFGDNGDVRLPRSGEESGDVYRELESLIRRSGSGAHEDGADSHAIPSGWKQRSSSSRPDHHNNKSDQEFLFETTSEAESSETTTSKAEVEEKPDGNKLLWLCMFTTVAYIIGCSLHLSNPLHP